ncbi:ATP-binding protein [Comamonas sp. J-3]|uniref:PAS domain-containing sensor histidine kinase n=1 Tax=Comamonas trifloxystrobinivorans TaxID=3350256 RepID=UPI0037282BE7
MTAAPNSNADALWFAPAQLLRLFGNSPVAMAYWGHDQHLRLATPQWCEWFGIPSSGVAGQLLTEALPAAFLETHRDALQAAALGQRQQFDHSKTDAHGVTSWRRISLSPYIWQGQANPKAADGVLMLMQDCSAEYAARAEVAAQREHLASLSSTEQERTEEKAELLKLRTLLDWRTAMLAEHSEMLQLLSHEIRQPLNNASAAMQATMKAIADLHLEQATPASKALLRAEHVLQQVIGTLDNTLAAGTILAVGGKAGASSDTDLPTLINLVLHDIAADNRPRIQVVWDADVRTVQLHPALMRLSIRNLLNNALNYAPADTQVLLRIAESDDPLALIIEVIDEGPGISEELRPRLFDKGSRGAEHRHRAGAGLGLFIVRSVVQLHQGTVQALPREPHGTIMRMELPQGLDD